MPSSALLRLSLTVLAFSTVISLANPVDDIFARHAKSQCSTPEGAGYCDSPSKCKGISYPGKPCRNKSGDGQCCVEIGCKNDGGSGVCRSVSHNGCPGGIFHPGRNGPPWPCPGDDDIQCCIPNGYGMPPSSLPSYSTPTQQSNPSYEPGKSNPSKTPSSTSYGDDVGAKVLAQAMTAAGMPYSWGGGSCSGPSADATTGQSGYDCSGLVCWALCQVTGRDLFNEGLRNTQTMYCAPESELKYKKYPYEQRKPGDALFFGGGCDCSEGSNIHHVGLMIDSDDRMWNAPNHQIDKVLEMSISGFGEKPCPQVIRFTG